MSTNYDDGNREREFTDAAVSTAYRVAATEMCPVLLDRKILREAAKEVKSGREFFWGVGWLRPMTFVTTLGLCIALLLEFSEYRVFDQPSGVQMNAVGVVPEPKSDLLAGDQTVNGSSGTDDEAKTRIEESAGIAEQLFFDRAEPDTALPALSTVPLATLPAQSQVDPMPLNRDSDNSEPFREAAVDAAKQVRAIDASESAALQEMPKAEVVNESAAPVSGERASDEALTPQQCTDEQRANADDWWLCVSELRRVGLVDEAERELGNLRDVFPQFSPQ